MLSYNIICSRPFSFVYVADGSRISIGPDFHDRSNLFQIEGKFRRENHRKFPRQTCSLDETWKVSYSEP